MSSRRLFMRLVVLTGGAALLQACAPASPVPKPTAAGATAGPATNATTGPAATSSGGPRRGGSLRVGATDNPRSLHSQVGGEVLIANTIYDALVGFDEQLNPLPRLAESWETPDEKTLVLRLRKGVKFHDGTNFDGEAVKFNIEDTKNPATKSPFSSDLEPIDTVEVVDSSTVKLHLKGGGAALLAAFGLQAGHMVSPTARKKYGDDFGRNPVGAGPYQFVEWVENDHITLKRNPTYWDQEAAYLDEVVFRIVPDPTVRLTNLKTGEMDVIAALAFKDVAPLRNNASYQLLRTWAGADRFIMNNSKPPFNNMALRQALQLAYDREGMHKSVFYETGVIAFGPVHPPGSWAFDPSWKPFERDLDKARAKLKEGGAPDGFAFDIDISDAVNRQLAEAYQATYAALGIKMTINMMDGTQNFARATSLEYTSRLSTWQTTADPSPALWTPYHTRGTTNYLKYSNPKVDDLLDRALVTYDRTQRRAYYREVDQILADEAPAIIPYHRPRFDAASSRVNGIVSKADPQLDLRKAWLAA